MKNIDFNNEQEQNHFIKCNCGQYIDMRNLEEVLRHQHEMKLPETDWSYSIKVGEPFAYTKGGIRIKLN